MKQVYRHIIIFLFCLPITCYLPAQDKMPVWVKKSDFKGGKIMGAVSFSIGEKRFVCMGSDGNKFSKECWEYDADSDSWKK